MDANFLRELAVFLLNYAESIDPKIKPAPTKHQEWQARVLKAISFVESHGGTVPKKDFVAFCVNELGYDARGLGSYWNKPEDCRLLHLHEENGVELLTTSLKAVDRLVAAENAA